MTAIQEPNKVADLIRPDAPAADARNALGLGSMATRDADEFDPAGSAAAITADQLGVYNISQVDDLISSRQPLAAGLTELAALAGTGIARRTGADTWTVGSLAAGDIPDLSATYSVVGHTHAGLSTAMAAGTLWGGQGSGVPAAVAIGSGLSLSGGTLATTGGGGGGGLAVGSAVTGGGANRLLYEDGSQALAASANLTFDGTALGAARATVGGSDSTPLAVVGPVNAVPTLTANSAPSPYVASASTEVNLSNAAWMAFDQDPTTRWLAATTTGWLRIDLGASGAAACTTYRITGADIAAWSPKTWTFEGSADATAWTTLDTQVNAPTWTVLEVRTYTIASPASYRYYRLNITANEGDPSFVGLVQLDIVVNNRPILTCSAAGVAVGAVPFSVSSGLTVPGALAVGKSLSVAGTVTTSGNLNTGGSIYPGGSNPALTVGLASLAAYASAPSAFFGDAVTGDSIYRNTGGSLLFGATSGYSQLTISPTGTRITAPSPSTPGLVVRGAVSQSVNLTEWQDSTGATLAAVGPEGAFRPAALADSAAPTNALYYSTTQSKLAYKDPSGTVNVLY